MSELKHINRNLSGLRTNLQSVERALENIQARVDRALAAGKGPDLYEQIRERYGQPFADLHPPDGYFFLMDGQVPVFRRADPGEWWLGVDDTAFTGPHAAGLFLILRPVKRVVFVEDPEGNFTTLDHGPIVNYGKAMDHDMYTARPMIRYRREDTP